MVQYASLLRPTRLSGCGFGLGDELHVKRIENLHDGTELRFPAFTELLISCVLGFKRKFLLVSLDGLLILRAWRSAALLTVLSGYVCWNCHRFKYSKTNALSVSCNHGGAFCHRGGKMRALRSWFREARQRKEAGEPLTAGEGAVVEILTLLTIAMIAGLIVNLTYAFFFVPKPKEIDLQERIRSLTSSLNSAAKSISDIEGEIKQREALVQRLVKDAETASKLAGINREQVDAVAQALKGEIERDQERNFWSTQLLALFYTLLGVVLAEVFHLIQRRWSARKKDSRPGLPSS